MKTTIKFFAAIIAISAFSFNAYAQNPTATASATASGTIVTPIAIENVQNLMFGNIIASAVGGTVTIANDGSRTLNGVAAPSIEGTSQEAQFKVTGMTGAAFAVTMPGDGVVALAGPGENMTLTAFTNNSTNTITGGEVTFAVGATLNVNAAQVAGEYSGTFEIAVNYN